MLRPLFALMLLLALGAASVRAEAELPERFGTLRSIAEQGDADAQFFIGRHFFEQASDPDAARQALEWLGRSARQQHAHAMLMLARLLQFSGSPVRDLSAAFRWYRRAADLGMAEAELQLGNFYLAGLGEIEQDCARALALYESAMSKGQSSADTNIVWLLSTCPDPAIRDGRRAVRLGMDIVYEQGRATANELENLAAAFAESGDYRSAWETQEDALEKLPADHPDRPDYETRLGLYRQKRNWRETAQ